MSVNGKRTEGNIKELTDSAIQDPLGMEQTTVCSCLPAREVDFFSAIQRATLAGWWASSPRSYRGSEAIGAPQQSIFGYQIHKD